MLPSLSLRSTYLISKGAETTGKGCYPIVTKFVTTLEASSPKEPTGICYQVTNFQLLGK